MGAPPGRRRTPRCCSRTPITRATLRCRPFSRRFPAQSTQRDRRTFRNRFRSSRPVQPRRGGELVISESKARWQQVTALVSLGASGTITGFSFVPSAPADLTSPSSMPIRLMALEKSATAAPADDAALRSAIVNVANYYLRMAAGQDAGRDGGDHLAARQHRRRRPRRVVRGLRQPDARAGRPGRRPAELGDRRHDLPVAAAQVGRRPGRPESGLARHHLGAAGRAGARPLASARRRLPAAARRLGAVRRPRRGGHQVRRRRAVHDRRRLAAELLGERARVRRSARRGRAWSASSTTATWRTRRGRPPRRAARQAASPARRPARSPARPAATAQAAPGSSAIPGAPAPGSTGSTGGRAGQRRGHTRRAAARRATAGHARPSRHRARPGHWHAAHAHEAAPAGQPGARPLAADVPGASVYGPSMAPGPASASSAAIPGLATTAKHGQRAGDARTAGTARRPARHRYRRPSAQQAFINAVAPGAMATQRRYGVPAAVTIAQAIDESGWGQSMLATNDHNLFGIKGTGPAGSDVQPTEEYENGQWITTNAPFRVYHNVAQSIEDHGRAAGDQRLLHAGHGQPQQPGRVRERPDRRLRHQSRVRRRSHQPHAAVQPVPLRRRAAEPGARRARPSPGRTATPRPARPSPGPAPSSSAPSGSSPSARSGTHARRRPRPAAPSRHPPRPSQRRAPPSRPRPRRSHRRARRGQRRPRPGPRRPAPGPRPPPRAQPRARRRGRTYRA